SFGGLSGASFGIRSWASLIVAVSITKWFLIKGCALAPGEHARHGARRSSFGRANPRSQQPRIFDARRAKTPNDSRAGAVGGSGPMAERSEIRPSATTAPPPKAIRHLADTL